MQAGRATPGKRAEEIVAVAARLGGAPDLGATLQGIAAAARSALTADRATCYVHDLEARVVSAVYSTEEDPARRAFLERSLGMGTARLPILRLQLAQSDPLLTIEDIGDDPEVPPALAGLLGAGALLGLRLEHQSVSGDGTPGLLGTLYCSYSRPRRFSEAERQAARGLANLASLALANARLQAETAEALDENRAMAAEQASLRRVATGVAGETSPDEVFGQAAEEVAVLLGVEEAIVTRFGPDGATVVGTHGEHSQLGECLPTVGGGALAQVARTGAPAEIRDYTALEPGSPLRAHALAHGYRASVAAPVTAAGQLWGALLATTKRDGGLAGDAPARLGRFAELVALAIANAEARRRLVAQAASDPLTGLANHRAFFERLNADVARARRHGSPLSLVMIDLDHFKHINDTFGHPIGDRVLVEVGERLGSLAREADTLARIGGEEFAWLLPESDGPAALNAAQRARQAIAGAPFPEAGRLTTSAGVAQLADGASVNDLVRAADAALYRAKAQGRNACALHVAGEDPAVEAGGGGVPGSLTPSIERLLALARDQLGLELAAIGEFEAGHVVWRYLDGEGAAFGMEAGGRIPLEESFCQGVVEGRLPELIRDAAADDRVRHLPITAAAGVGAYLGVPITLPDGGLYGMLCCLSPRPAPDLGEGDVRLLRMVAGMLGEEFGHGQRRTAEQRDHRERVLRVLAGAGLEAVLQPIVELAGGRVVGAEALSRFSLDPARRVEAWFSEAASVGLGVELELAAIGVALGRLPDLPARARLCLNVSPATLLAPALADLLSTAPGDRLALELTEHVPVDDYASLADALARHRSRGVQLMIDDAGAGFASLRHVLGLRPDAIKLDLSLTRDIDVDPMRQALAASLVTFAGRIGAIIVAEGIETHAALETLTSLGVTHGQGYHLARPSHGPLPAWVSLGEPTAATAPAR